MLPEQQGMGYATAGMRLLIDLIRDDPTRHAALHAYPSVDNAASNSICRKLGFTLVKTLDFEYPAGSGNKMSCNDWRLDLGAV